MPRIVFAALVLLSSGVMVAWRVRAHWVDRKIAAATAMPAIVGQSAGNCGSERRADIVITGDSRVAQWPMRLFDGLPVANTGIAGETALQLTARFERDVLRCRPRTVLIATGINDLVAASLATEEQAREIVVRLPGLLIGLADAAAGNGATVFVATILPPARPDLLRRLAWSATTRVFVADVNRRLRVHPWTGSVALVDFAAALDPQGTGELPDAFRRDTLHINEAAYGRLTRLLPFAEAVRGEDQALGLATQAP